MTGRIVLHNDFTNLLYNVAGPDPADLERIADRELSIGADFISLRVADPETCFYYPAQVAEVRPASASNDRAAGPEAVMRALTDGGVDPYGLVVGRLRAGGCRVLAKLRVNDCHHVTGFPERSSRFWLQHPEWRIGRSETGSDIEQNLCAHPSVGPIERDNIAKRRSLLLDYAVPEVRRHRLSIVREFMERYDVDGLTLNFLREPYCVSFPARNAHLLTEFVSGCREIVNESVRRRGEARPILGAVLPWDPAFCRNMGLEVEQWIEGGLLDYVSPTETWVTSFNMPIRSWAGLASGTPCAVYPGIIGMTSYNNDVCLPEEYQTVKEDDIRGERPKTSKPTRENVRALAHGFYAEGADGVSTFNLYTRVSNDLYPLPEICRPESISGKERHYIHLADLSVFGQHEFLQLRLGPGPSARGMLSFRLHEDLREVDASVRLKARKLAQIADLHVDVNGVKVAAGDISLIPHRGAGFLYLQFPLRRGMLRDGENELGFILHDGGAGGAPVIVQEVEIRVIPR